MKVRCNWCMETYDEEDIPLDSNGDEYCSHCNKYGFIVDLKEEEE